MPKKSSGTGLFGVIALAGFLAFTLAACGGAGDGSKCQPGGFGTSGEPYIICTAQDLAALATEVNSGDNKSGVYYKLAGDINLSAYRAGAGWTPIGYDGNYPFRGHFDGDGKTVSNLAINTTLEPAGLFGCLYGATVENLGVEIAPAGITGAYNVGGVAGEVDFGGAINNCHVTGGDITGTNHVGAVAGWVRESTVSNSFATNNVTSTGYEIAGGLVGVVYGGAVYNCHATGAVAGARHVGGVVGVVSDSTTTVTSIVSNCHATGDVTGNSEVGGVVGTVFSVAYGSRIRNCYATGNVMGTTYVGGVAGVVSEDSTVSNCYATGDVTGYEYVGGAAGSVGFNSSLSNCYSMGDIAGHTEVGGVAGVVSDNSSVSNCYATGSVTGGDYIGGVAGYVSNDSVVRNCAALNEYILSAGSNTGRVAGFFGNSGGVPAIAALINNVAFDGIPFMASDPFLDGASIDADQVHIQSTYQVKLGWFFGGNDANPWKWGGSLPILYWQTQVPIFPSHLR